MAKEQEIYQDYETLKKMARKDVLNELKQDVNSVLNMLSGTTERGKIANYIKEYMLKNEKCLEESA